MTTAIVQRVVIYPLVIPMRWSVSHAQAQRAVSDPVVVSVELGNGMVGFGEALPRSDPARESVDSIIDAARSVFLPFMLEFHPQSFPAALEAIEALPWTDAAGRPVPAARAAVELALLDAVLRTYNRGIGEVAGWMGIPGFGQPGSIKRIRYSGVLAFADSARSLKMLRLLYWAGLRHFKLEIGTPDDRALLGRVAGYLRKPIERGNATLRVDANGTWTKDEAIDWLAETKDLSIAAVEQPLPRGTEDELAILRDLFETVLVHDESLNTLEDGQRLIELGVADGFNIGLGKCGGMLPSLRLAALARRSNVRIQLGCMIGETAVLSCAGLRFLEACPGVQWAEGCWGSFLLSRDVSTRRVRFGLGGKPPRIGDAGLGADVDVARLRALCCDKPIVSNL